MAADAQPRQVLKSAVRVDNVEQMEPLQLFQVYSDQAKMSRGAFDLGVGLLSEVESDIKALKTSRVGLRSVELEGYGPFHSAVRYVNLLPLYSRDPNLSLSLSVTIPSLERPNIRKNTGDR